MSTHLFIVRLWKKFAVDDAFLLSAAIAWGVLFAIVPFLALGIGLTGFVLSARFDDPTEAVLELFARNLPQGAAGEEFARMLDALVGEVMTSRTGLTVVGSLVFVWLATRLSGTLRSVLATVFETDNTRGIVHGKAFDIAVVLLGVFLVTLNIGVTVLGAAAVRFGVEIVGLGGGTVSIAERALGAGIAFLSIWTLFLLIYRYLPRVRTPWRTTLVASTFAGVVHEFVK
ncbi:MAG: YihY/virulence factor BrkB family protein, partial [Gemmatimonadota bacterium]|nr:YihY/virulence factor BrkB family protein [Gemmatimonadota bacterium]